MSKGDDGVYRSETTETTVTLPMPERPQGFNDDALCVGVAEAIRVLGMQATHALLMGISMGVKSTGMWQKQIEEDLELEEAKQKDAKDA